MSSHSSKEHLLFRLLTTAKSSTQGTSSKHGGNGEDELVLFFLGLDVAHSVEDLFTLLGSDLDVLLLLTAHEATHDGRADHRSEEWEDHLLLFTDLTAFEHASEHGTTERDTASEHSYCTVSSRVSQCRESAPSGGYLYYYYYYYY